MNGIAGYVLVIDSNCYSSVLVNLVATVKPSDVVVGCVMYCLLLRDSGAL